MRQYTNSSRQIPEQIGRRPNVVPMFARFPVSAEPVFHRVSGTRQSRMLGATMKRKAPTMPMAPAEKLYIQVRIRLFIDGEEQALDQLWSDAGPVSRLHDAKPYFTMSAALRKSQELLSQKTMEYQVVAADVVSESSITIARRVAQ